MADHKTLYKSKSQFGHVKEERRRSALEVQKRRREATFLVRRNIPEDGERERLEEPAPAEVKTTRLERLKKWKAEKVKRIEQEKLCRPIKPPFVVGVFHPPVNPLERVTRSKTAAAKASAFSSKGNLPPMSFVPKSSKSQSTSSAPSRGITSVSSVSRSKISSTTLGISKRGPSALKKLRPVKSFAPENHEFKAPSSLTFPLTPLMLKKDKKMQPSQPQNQQPQQKPVLCREQAPHKAAMKSSSSKRKQLMMKSEAHPTVDQAPNPSFSENDQHQSIGKAPGKVIRKSLAGRKSLVRKGVVHPTKSCESSLKKQLVIEKKLPVPGTSTLPKNPHQCEEGALATRTPNRSSCKKEQLPTDMATPSCGTTSSSDLGAKKLQFSGTKSSSWKIQKLSKEKDFKPSFSDYNLRKTRSSDRGKENIPVTNIGLAKTDVGPKDGDGESVDSTESIRVKAERMSIHEPSPPVSTPPQLPDGMVPAQFSPYIVTARGKERHTPRRASRVSCGSEDIARQKQVKKFQELVDKETSRLLSRSDDWECRIKDAPTAIQDEILATIGQARLLSKDKFQQFQKLIDQYANGKSEHGITVDDLTGFWEMLLLTVDNIDQRFSKLEKLEVNNWMEEKMQLSIKPQAMEKKRQVQTSKAIKPKAAQVISRIRGVLKEARKRNMMNSSTSMVNASSFDGGFFLVSPLKVKPSSGKKTPGSARGGIATDIPSRQSLLQQVLTNSASRSICPATPTAELSGSPILKNAVALMRASERGKRCSVGSPNEPCPTSPIVVIPETNSAQKSILKTRWRQTISESVVRNRVAFRDTFTAYSPLALISDGTPAPTISARSPSAISALRPRFSLIPRLVQTPLNLKSPYIVPSTPTPNFRPPSLLPVIEGLAPTELFPNGDLIDLNTSTPDFMVTRRGTRISASK